MISFVVPVFNEEESLEFCYQELSKTIAQLKKDYELIFIDDGSTDKSLEILKNLASKNQHIRIYSFRKNFGKAEALNLGFIKSNGDYVVTIDADLQDKPHEIPKLLARAEEGVDVVSGWRKDRKDKSKMKIISKMFNFFMGWFFDLKLHDYNCGLKLYKRDAVKSIRIYGGLHRFIPLLAYEQGFSVDEVPTEHSARKYGKSKYGFSKLWKDLPDMFTMLFLVKYSKRPLHFFGLFGMIVSAIGFVILIYLSYLHFLGQAIGSRPLLFLGLLLIISGFQIFFTGFLAELLINISHAPRLSGEEHLRNIIKYSTDDEKFIK